MGYREFDKNKGSASRKSKNLYERPYIPTSKEGFKSERIKISALKYTRLKISINAKGKLFLKISLEWIKSILIGKAFSLVRIRDNIAPKKFPITNDRITLIIVRLKPKKIKTIIREDALAKIFENIKNSNFNFFWNITDEVVRTEYDRIDQEKISTPYLTKGEKPTPLIGL